jgi:hypothetical protein
MNNREFHPDDHRKDLDRILTSAEQNKIAEVIRMAPQDEVGMAWRSNLNERLGKVAQESKQKKQMRRRIWGYSTGLGFSGAAVASLFFMVMTRVPDTPEIISEQSIEAQLYTAHRETARSTDVAGSGLALCDESDNSSETQNVKWKVEDLEAL